MPRTAHTNIGDSEHPGGMKSYCSASARTSDVQGLLPNNFWKNVEFKTGKGNGGKKWAQCQCNIHFLYRRGRKFAHLGSVTGCIRPETVDRLNPRDAGGQYDSSGGVAGRGNPEGSMCIG